MPMGWKREPSYYPFSRQYPERMLLPPRKQPLNNKNGRYCLTWKSLLPCVVWFPSFQVDEIHILLSNIGSEMMEKQKISSLTFSARNWPSSITEAFICCLRNRKRSLVLMVIITLNKCKWILGLLVFFLA